MGRRSGPLTVVFVYVAAAVVFVTPLVLAFRNGGHPARLARSTATTSATAPRPKPPATNWPSTPVSADPLESVSCTSSQFCMVGDQNGGLFSYNGHRWSRSGTDADNSLKAISCTSTTFCAAVDDFGDALLFDGRRWSPSDIDASNAFTGVSCATPTFCVAVDVNGHAAVFDGAKWSLSDIDGFIGLHAVSCTSPTFCVASDDMGGVLTYNGSAWALSNIDIDNGLPVGLLSMSCTSPTFCVTGDRYGSAFTFDGSQWVGQSRIDGSDSAINGVACVTPSLCFAGTSRGRLTNFDGTTWTVERATTSEPVNAVSCAAEDFCVAVGDSGDAFVSFDPAGGSEHLNDAHAHCKRVRLHACSSTPGRAASSWSAPPPTTSRDRG